MGLINEFVSSGNGLHQGDTAEELIPLLREQFISSLITGMLCDAETVKRQSEILKLNINMEAPCVETSLSLPGLESFLSNRWQYGSDKLHISIINLLTTDNDDAIFICARRGTGKLQLLTLAKNSELKLDKLTEIVNEQIKRSADRVLEYLDMDMVIRYQNAYETLIQCLEQKKDNHKNLLSDIKAHETSKPMANLNAFKSAFISAMINEDETNLEILKNDILSQIESSGEQYLQIITELMQALCRHDVFATDCEELPADKEKLKTLLENKFLQMAALASKRKHIWQPMLHERITEHIKHNMVRDYTISECATQLMVLPIDIERILNEISGESFVDYMSRMRMEGAMRLLENNDIALNEVGARIGIPNNQLFARMFRRHTGVSPANFKRNHNKE